LSELLAELPKQKIIFQYDMLELNEDLEFSCGCYDGKDCCKDARIARNDAIESIRQLTKAGLWERVKD